MECLGCQERSSIAKAIVLFSPSRIITYRRQIVEVHAANKKGGGQRRERTAFYFWFQQHIAMALATSVRVTALVLLGCRALALPSTRVAFSEHGVAEGDEPVLHPPITSRTRMASLTPQLLASAIARVMSLDSRAEVDTALPAGDIFNRPDANVLVFVDGLRPEGGRKLPKGADWKGKGLFGCGVDSS